MTGLPLFELTIDDRDEVGVTAVALVDKPAIERAFMAFKNVEQRFKATDSERKIVSGALMVPDMPIYRKDNERGEYMAFYSADTIWKMNEKFMRQNKGADVNLMHDPKQLAGSGTYLIESFIIDESRGIKTPENFEPLPNGSWFVSYKVGDAIWQDFIKTGVFTGFSLEGMFEMQKVDDEAFEIRNYVAELSEEEKFYQSIQNMKAEAKEQLKGKFPALYKIFFSEEAAPEQKFTEAKLKDGTVVAYEGELTVGTTLFVRDEAGAELPAPEGAHELDNGTIVTVDATGVVIDIKEPEAEEDPNVAMAAAQAAFQKTVLDRLEAMEKKMNATAQADATFRTNIEAKFSAVGEAIVTLAETPTEEPTKPAKLAFQKEVNKEEQSARIRGMVAKGLYKDK